MDIRVHGYGLKDKFTTADGHKWHETPITFVLVCNQIPEKGGWIFIPKIFFDPETKGCKPSDTGVVDLRRSCVDAFNSNDVSDYKAAEVQNVCDLHTSPGYLPSIHVFTDGFR